MRLSHVTWTLCWGVLLGTDHVALSFVPPHGDLTSCASHVSLDIVSYGISGAASGGSRALARFLSYPLDTLKTIQQAESLEQIVLQQRDKPRDVSSLFRGVALAVCSAVPANSVFLVVFSSLEAYLPCVSSSDDALVRLGQRILISAIATVPQNLIKIPAELLKQRAQLADFEGGAVSLASVLADVKRLGLKGLYQGGTAMMLREVPFNGVQMATFFYLREASLVSLGQQWVQRLDLDPVVYSGALGLVAAGFAALITQPADTIKTRLMKVNAGNETIFSVAEKINEKRGLRGFYVGLKSRLALVSAGGLIYFATQSLTEKLLFH